MISVTANIAPGAMHALTAACLAGDMAEARTRMRRTNILNRAMFYENNPIPVKTAMALMGLDTGVMRLPLVPMGEANKARLTEALKAYGGLL